MSETAKTKAKPTGTSKPATNSGAKAVAESAEAKSTQAEQDALKAAEEKAKAEAEKQAKAEAEAKAKEEKAKADEEKAKQGNSNEEDKTKNPTGDAGDVAVDGVDSLGILGVFKVRAKSDQGFWRSGVQFLRKKETVILVVDEEPKDQPEIVAQKGIEPELVLFMSKAKAERVHREPNLVVENVELSDVLEID